MSNLVGQHISHYQIKSLLGSGRIGSVYQAVNLRDLSVVALKTVEFEFAKNPDLRLRFLQEIKGIPRLEHPSIINIHEAGIDTKLDMLYLTMEYVPNRNLNAYLQQLHFNNQQLGIAESLILTAQIAEALGYAHKKGMVHRDVRPNVILFRTDDHPDESGALPGRAAISDFTLLTLLEQETETFTGSLPYMAPEYFLSQVEDGRSDLYSLGIVLYQLLTGQLPFSAKNGADATRQHSSETPPSLHAIRPQLSMGIETAVFKAIAKKPADRYQTGAEMASALRAIADTLSERMEVAKTVEADANFVKTEIDLNPAPLIGITSSEDDQLTVTKDLPHSLNRQLISIGRSESSDIVLADGSISRQHAQLERTGDGWQVRDLGSENGTYLGGKPLLPDIPEEWNSFQPLRIGAYYLHLKLGKNRNANGQSFIVSVSPDEVEVRAGEQALLQIGMRNDSETVMEYQIEMARLPDRWVKVPAEPLRIRPNEQKIFNLAIAPPLQETLMGNHRYLLTISSSENPEDKVAVPGMVRVLPAADFFTATLEETVVDEKGHLYLAIENRSLNSKNFSISGNNPNNKLKYAVWRPKTAVSDNNATGKPSSGGKISGKNNPLGRLPALRRIQTAPQQLWRRMQDRPRQALNRILPGLGTMVPAIGTPKISKPTLPKRKTSTPDTYEKIAFPDALYTKISIPAGETEIVHLGVKSRKRPFWGSKNDSVSFKIGVNDGSDKNETLTGRLPVKPYIRSSAAAIVLTILIMLACLFAGYAYITRYNNTANAALISDDDRDGDGLDNVEEVYVYETDPNRVDTDDDGLTDGEEIAAGLNPRSGDSDGDDLGDAEEALYGTNPRLADSDGDTLPDGLEIFTLETNPLIPDDLPVIIPTLALTVTYIAPTVVPTAVSISTPVNSTPQPTIISDEAVVSSAAEDGYIIQESSGGHAVVADSETIQVGEGGSNTRQAKLFLSFDTSSIPTGAVIETAVLQLYQIESAGNMDNFGPLQMDIAPLDGFNDNWALEAADFSASAVTISGVDHNGAEGNGRWLNGILTIDALQAINPQGHTQFRVYYIVPNDNDGVEDWLRFLSGDSIDASLRPQLLITYK